MFNNDLQAKQLNNNINKLPAMANNKKIFNNKIVDFKGSVFAPRRDEEIAVKINDEVFLRQHNNQKKGRLAKIFGKFLSYFAIPEYDKYRTMETQNHIEPHKISYLA